MILLIDNYDSFVFNLARYFERLGQDTLVVRNDAIDVDGIRAIAPAAIVLSPGPCTPSEAGCSVSVVRELWQEYPMLGVCLGHQAIAAAFGARITRAPQPMHGRTCEVFHDQTDVYNAVPNPFAVCRYHSLVVEAESLPDDLAVTSRTEDGVVMGLAHRRAPIVGMQFHPESILTEHGYQLLSNFLTLARLVSDPLPGASSERLLPASPSTPLPTTPVTF